jgi:nicotinamidase/pyrazinamidase
MAMNLKSTDALLVVDVQRDFLPGGALGVAHGDEVIPVLNRYIALARKKGLPVYASRDWHPANHCSFSFRGGPWPVHCVAETKGAEFPPDLKLPPDTRIISKATAEAPDVYSAFDGPGLAQELRSCGVKRLLVGGLTTDYCVLNTVRDGLAEGFEVVLLKDAIRPVDVKPGDGERAEEEMRRAGAQPVTYPELAA